MWSYDELKPPKKESYKPELKNKNPRDYDLSNALFEIRRTAIDIQQELKYIHDDLVQASYSLKRFNEYETVKLIEASVKGLNDIIQRLEVR